MFLLLGLAARGRGRVKTAHLSVPTQRSNSSSIIFKRLLRQLGFLAKRISMFSHSISRCPAV